MTEMRTIDELIDLPYSEMSEEEIAIIVEFKANNQARDFMHSQIMEDLKTHMNEIAAITKAEADAHINELKERKERARARFESESVNNGQA